MANTVPVTIKGKDYLVLTLEGLMQELRKTNADEGLLQIIGNRFRELGELKVQKAQGSALIKAALGIPLPTGDRKGLEIVHSIAIPVEPLLKLRDAIFAYGGPGQVGSMIETLPEPPRSGAPAEKPVMTDAPAPPRVGYWFVATVNGDACIADQPFSPVQKKFVDAEFSMALSPITREGLAQDIVVAHNAALDNTFTTASPITKPATWWYLGMDPMDEPTILQHGPSITEISCAGMLPQHVDVIIRQHNKIVGKAAGVAMRQPKVTVDLRRDPTSDTVIKAEVWLDRPWRASEPEALQRHILGWKP